MGAWAHAHMQTHTHTLTEKTKLKQKTNQEEKMVTHKTKMYYYEVKKIRNSPKEKYHNNGGKKTLK